VPGNLRASTDSAGRAEFLNTLVKKEVLALTALATNKALTFEDRAQLRKVRDRAMSNALYIRHVWDSVTVSDEEVLEQYEQFKVAVGVRRLLIDDYATAQKVRGDLAAGRLPWDQAVQKFPSPVASRTDPVWIERRAMPREFAAAVMPLRPGEFSPIISDPGGFVILQVVGHKSVDPPAFEVTGRFLRDEIQMEKVTARAVGVRERLAREIGVVYDTTNIRFAVSRFPSSPVLQQDQEGPILDLSLTVPTFSDKERARVLARHRDGAYTLGEFVDAYNGLSRMARMVVGDFEVFRAQLDIFILDPYFVQLAEERGLETDSLVVGEVEREREKIMVEHLYRDSVMAYVRVTPEDCRRHYEAHKDDFISTPRVRYAQFVRGNRAAADSLAGRLKGSKDRAAEARTDSLAGHTASRVHEIYDHEQGPLHKLMFEELIPGDVTVLGPSEEGSYTVYACIERLPGRLIGFEEAERFIDESLRNQRSEGLLEALIARHRPKYRIETHPELVAKILLVDPALLQ
jgi:hypothetical protein